MTRAVVLARGLGTRMRRSDEAVRLDGDQATAADAGLKVMMPVGRPFLDYVISGLADVGISDVCLVIGAEHQVIRDRYDDACRPRRLRVSYALQASPRGTADAVLAAAEFVALGDTLVVNGDNLYPRAALEAVCSVGAPSLGAFSADALTAGGLIDSDRIAKFAIVDADDRGRLLRVIEKPPRELVDQPGVRVSMNLWAFEPSILDACARVAPSPRGELELPDAVRLAIEQSASVFTAVPLDLPVIDLSTRADIAHVRARLAGVEVAL